MVRTQSAAVESANQELRMLEHDTEVFRRQFFDWLSRHVERTRDQHELFEKSLNRLISTENELNSASNSINAQINQLLMKRDDYVVDTKAIESQRNSNEKILASMPQIIHSSSKELYELENNIRKVTLEKQSLAKNIEYLFIEICTHKIMCVDGRLVEFLLSTRVMKKFLET